jgi:hypothetical protein
VWTVWTVRTLPATSQRRIRRGCPQAQNVAVEHSLAPRSVEDLRAEPGALH